MEILFIHPGALGDIILSLPAVAIAKARYPAARIAFAANIDYVAATIFGKFFDRPLSFASLPLHGFYSDEPARDLSFWLSFDRIISWTGSGDDSFAGKISSLHPHASVHPWRPHPKESRHVAQIFIDSLGPEISLGKSAEPAGILLNSELSRQGYDWLRGQGWNGTDRLVAIHPGAGSSLKRWPLYCYAHVAQRLVSTHSCQLVIVEGPAESGLAEEMRTWLSPIRPIIVRELSLDGLAAVLNRSALFVGNDSGIAHLSAALGISSVVLFGPTLPRHWAPLGRSVSVLHEAQGSLEKITVENVIEACLRAFPPMQ